MFTNLTPNQPPHPTTTKQPKRKNTNQKKASLNGGGGGGEKYRKCSSKMPFVQGSNLFRKTLGQTFGPGSGSWRMGSQDGRKWEDL